MKPQLFYVGIKALIFKVHKFFNREEISQLEPRLNEVYEGLMDQVLNPGLNKLSEEKTIIY